MDKNKIILEALMDYENRYYETLTDEEQILVNGLITEYYKEVYE